MVIKNFTRRLKDPSALTPYERKIYELRQEGLTYAQMSERLGGKINSKSLASRYMIIREKLKAVETDND